jgi:hypothetical protein
MRETRIRVPTRSSCSGPLDETGDTARPEGDLRPLMHHARTIARACSAICIRSSRRSMRRIRARRDDHGRYGGGTRSTCGRGPGAPPSEIVDEALEAGLRGADPLTVHAKMLTPVWPVEGETSSSEPSGP